MPIMFHMMNEARIGVGVQGLAGAAAAYNYALAYAREREQGASIDQIQNPDAERVAIVNHPDVRRMLMLQKVQVETMRSFLYTTALRMDRLETHPEKEEADYLLGLVDLMVPIAKAHCTDLGFEFSVIGFDGEQGIFVVIVLAHVKQFAAIVEAGLDFFQQQHNVFQRFFLAAEFLGALGVVPDLRVFHLLRQEGQALAFLIVVKDTSAVRRRAAPDRRACRRCC